MATFPLVVLVIISLLEIKALEISRVNSPRKPGEKRTLDDIRSSRQYQDMLQEMLRVSQETVETFDEDETRLRRIVGEDNFNIFQGGVSRRRAGSELRSAVGRRRARSQALRREKLNSQGLRSHMQHTKQAYDYSSEAAN